MLDTSSWAQIAVFLSRIIWIIINLAFIHSILLKPEIERSFLHAGLKNFNWNLFFFGCFSLVVGFI